ncbi:metal-dependent hydrolase [Bailinhaonella thermotolerans]|uniref:Metal-dependent hydrolase n=2 Tax=Bailinhaonella thermotolerans TaxID=1070861 RepID=A0A3A4A8A3_9ACTN|nr:metal-dependent hydrolase [Bailinhaonella thermotolerans]
MGVYAIAWFLAAFLVVPLVRLAPPARLVLGSGLLLVAARIALQFTGGHGPQLHVAGIGLLAGLAWLVATAMASRDAAPSLAGLTAGLAASTVLHAALDTIDLVWRSGPIPWLPLAIELGLFVFLLSKAAGYGPAASPPPRRFAEHGPEPATAPRAWVTAGPAILLWGLYTGNTAYAHTAAGPPGALIVTAGAVLSVALAVRPGPWTRHPLYPALGLLASAVVFVFGRVARDGVHGVAPWWAVAGQVLGQFALAGCLGWAAALTGPGARARRGLAAAGGLLLFVVLVFAYFSAYDLHLPNGYVPIAAAVVVGAIAVVAARPVGDSSPGYGYRLPAAAALSVLLVAAAPLWRGPADRGEPVADGLRVAAYNVRMGYDLAGTLSVERQADALRALRAHVIVLSEVDRSWFLNGGHDGLALLADRLGMRALWAPAADPSWGDALLTDLPVTSVRNHVLPQGGPTGAQALEVGVRWRGRDVTVISTHLQPPPGWNDLTQARELARVAKAAAAGGPGSGPRPVIVAGDLNIEPGTPAWQAVLDAGLTDAFAASRPFVTIPGGSREQIDHVLVTPGLTPSAPANPDVPHSDHRPVAVTLTPGP